MRETFLVRRLAPHFVNVGKRLIKAPKVYIRDTGILHALLGLSTIDQVLRHPVAGFSWEGLVIEQFAAILPMGWSLSFWRTAAGAEIDLLILAGDQPRVALEMKMNETSPRPGRGFFQGCEDIQPGERWVVYPGERALPLPHGMTALPLAEAICRFRLLAAGR
jgi:predicted AAA+ superfamily ATPase